MIQPRCEKGKETSHGNPYNNGYYIDIFFLSISFPQTPLSKKVYRIKISLCFNRNMSASSGEGIICRHEKINTTDPRRRERFVCVRFAYGE